MLSNLFSVQAFTVISVIFIAVTVILLVLGSLPSMQRYDPLTNITDVDPMLETADAVCVGWFTMEYIIRFWASPSRFEYFRSPLSLIDLVAILPFYVELFGMLGFNQILFRSFIVMRLLRMLRVLRVLRILKVARYSGGFRAVGRALYCSYKELSLLGLFMLSASMMFSTLMYFFERDEPYTGPSDIRSIPDAAWWCIMNVEN